MGLIADLQARAEGPDAINKAINHFVGEWADDKTEKRIPYIGWFWRTTDFIGKQIWIGKTDSGYIGVMENNKWDYPERMMVDEEVDTFIAYLEKAYAALEEEGNDEDRRARASAVFAELHAWFQTLNV